MKIGNFAFAVIMVFFAPHGFADNSKNVVRSSLRFESKSLCEADDTIFFSCQTRHEKIISLCGKGKINDMKNVYYRFGRPDKIEMNFPEVINETTNKNFSYDSYHRYRVDWISISFTVRNYHYAVYSNYKGDDPDIGEQFSRGISVENKQNNSHVDILCVTDFIGDLHDILDVLEGNGFWGQVNEAIKK